MFALQLVTAPTTEPVSLEELKNHCRVDGNDMDSQLTLLLRAARQWTESVTGRAFSTQTFDLVIDETPATRQILIPRSPVQSITSATYIDSAGATQTWASTNYTLNTHGFPSRLELAYGATWPALITAWNAMTIRFVTGSSALVGGTPEPVRQAIMLRAQALLDRDPAVRDLLTETADSLLSPYRIAWLS